MLKRARILLISFMAVSFILAGSEAKADGTWWDVFFPSNRNLPAETLQAPFADPDAVILEPEGDSVLALSTRHRPNLEIAEWVEEKISELVIFTAQNYEAEYRDKTKYFDKAGTAEYLKFLQDNNILKPLSSGSYDIKGFSSDLPNVLNEGALAGRYRWLLQVPVMITFVKTGTNDYKKSSPSDTLTMEYIVNLQVGRTNVAPDDYGIVIESWKAVLVQKETE